MNKERVSTKELGGDNCKYHPDDWSGVKLVSQEQTDFDGEKGFCDYVMVVQRLSDNKFFKFTYTDYGCGEDDISEQVAYEVEQKTKTVFYYE